MKILLLLLTLIIIGIILLCVIYNELLQCVYYQIPKEEVPKAFHGSKIVVLADLHSHQFGKKNKRLIEKIEKENPDYIILAGDMLVKGKELKTEVILYLLEKLSIKYPVYYAPGNHEEYLERAFLEKGEYDNFIRDVKMLGVKYLANESCYIEKNQEKLKITGLHLPDKFYKKFYNRIQLNEHDLEKFIGKKQENYEILIAHNPTYFSTYQKWGADLVLSGHVHGGIVILPLLGGVISTTYEPFPKYDFGMFQNGKCRMILTRGLGTHTIKLRLFNIPEISVITFH